MPNATNLICGDSRLLLERIGHRLAVLDSSEKMLKRLCSHSQGTIHVGRGDVERHRSKI